MDERYGQRYAELYRRHWWWRARERVLLEEIRALRAGRPSGKVLDVGCGDGLFLGALEEFGEVQGLEPDAALVSTESSTRFRIHIGPLDDTFTPSGQYDLILFLDVLEHLDDPASVLRRAASLLAPGGDLLVTVPAYPWLWTNHDTLNEHVERFTPEALARLARSAGCRIVRLRQLFQWAVGAKLLVRAWETIRPSKPKPPGIPPAPVNQLLLGLCRLEDFLARVVPMPVGSSLLAVIRPDGTPTGP